MTQLSAAVCADRQRTQELPLQNHGQLQRALTPVDRPEILIWQHTSNLEEDPVRVLIGFRFRPLRDGGGLPSPGIRPPHKRSHAGASILRTIQPWLPSLASRLDVTSKGMFTDSQLHNIRRCLSLRDRYKAEGQPFYLDLLSEVAVAANDPDSNYPLVLATGVPLGVTSPTLDSSNIWPTKEEMSGEPTLEEDLPDPISKDNYRSAIKFEDYIEGIFTEERAMGMVLGPYTIQEAARACDCSPLGKNGCSAHRSALFTLPKRELAVWMTSFGFLGLTLQ